MSNGNGQASPNDVLTTEEKLDVILEALTDLNERFEELVEKVANLSLDDSAYGIEKLFEED